PTMHDSDISPLSLHDALPISGKVAGQRMPGLLDGEPGLGLFRTHAGEVDVTGNLQDGGEVGGDRGPGHEITKWLSIGWGAFLLGGSLKRLHRARVPARPAGKMGSQIQQRGAEFVGVHVHGWKLVHAISKLGPSALHLLIPARWRSVTSYSGNEQHRNFMLAMRTDFDSNGGH